MNNTTTRVLLVRGGAHWQLQTGFLNPSGKGCATYNLGTLPELGSNPPYEAAALLLHTQHGVTTVTWTPGMPETDTLPAAPDMAGVWHTHC